MTDGRDTATREMGIEFGQLVSNLEDEAYPLSRRRLLEKHGDAVLELANGSATLREVLRISDQSEYEDAEAVRQMVFSLVGDDAIGRQGYCDRGAPSADQAENPASF